MACLLLLLALTPAVGASPETCESNIVSADAAPSLLQSHHVSHSESDSKNSISFHAASSLGINPSGAAAPLDQSGYGAVADRCCQAEMQVFIARQVTNLGMEVCEAAGLRGITPYHSCGLGPLTFAILTSNLLDDSTKECAWVAKIGECKPLPKSCDFGDVPPLSDCGCSRGKAAKLDFSSATLIANNLGGVGPVATDPQELRFSQGVSSTGKPFELVVTTLNAYTAANLAKNGKSGGFAVINMKAGTSTDFKFSFVSPGTNNPVVLEEIHMAMFDLDGSEKASSKGYTGYVTDAAPSVIASLAPDGRTEFKSGGNSNIPNPFLPSALTAQQRKNSVMYFYTGVSSFELNFEIEVSGSSGRNLFFAFESALDDRCGD